MCFVRPAASVPAVPTREWAPSSILPGHRAGACPSCAAFGRELMRLLAAAPLTEITADELCRGARRPRRALHWHTGGVRGCLRTTYATLLERVLPSFEGPLARDDWGRGLTAGVLAVAAHLEAEPGAARFFLVDAPAAADETTLLLRAEAHRRLTRALAFTVIVTTPPAEANDLQVEMLATAIPDLLARRLLADGHLRDWRRIAAETEQLARIFGCAPA